MNKPAGMSGVAGMAYVVVIHKEQEVARRKLEGRVLVGRSPECAVAVRDVLLSRRHCQIEPAGRSWVVTDLGSKNGTRVGRDLVTHRILHDGNVVRIGNTKIRFHAGPFVPAAPRKESGLHRPADPFEALANTVSDFPSSSSMAAASIPGRFASPRPTPREPAGYSDDSVRSLVDTLVSSSWDSIYQNASRRSAHQTGGVAAEPTMRVRRSRPRDPHVALALQARAEPAVSEAAALPEALLRRPPRRLPSASMVFLVRRLAMIFQWLALLMLLWPR